VRRSRPACSNIFLRHHFDDVISRVEEACRVSVEQGPSFGAPTEVFQVRVAGGVSSTRTHYVPSREGKRFLINTPAGDPAMVPITVVLNWTAGLK
jgi:hypothetical protein